MPRLVTTVLECSRCHIALAPAAPHWREVAGWLQLRESGGAHGVHLERPTGRYLCVTCMGVLSLRADNGGDATPRTAACRECFTGLRRESPGWWREVTGWARARASGTNAVRWPRLTGQYLCAACMEHGTEVGDQLALFP